MSDINRELEIREKEEEIERFMAQCLHPENMNLETLRNNTLIGKELKEEYKSLVTAFEQKINRTSLNNLFHFTNRLDSIADYIEAISQLSNKGIKSKVLTEKYVTVDRMPKLIKKNGFDRKIRELKKNHKKSLETMYDNSMKMRIPNRLQVSAITVDRKNSKIKLDEIRMLDSVKKFMEEPIFENQYFCDYINYFNVYSIHVYPASPHLNFDAHHLFNEKSKVLRDINRHLKVFRNPSTELHHEVEAIATLGEL